MTIKPVISVALGVVFLASCGGGSLTVRTEAPDRVLIELPSDTFPRDMTIWQETVSDESVQYFEGNLSDRMPRDGHITLPRDFKLFKYPKFGPSFDPARFPKGKYVVSFFVNAEHGYEEHFEIK